MCGATITVMDANPTPQMPKIRIGDDIVQLERPSQGQLLGLAMVNSGGFSEEEQVELIMAAILKLIPDTHRKAFVQLYLSGGHTAADLIATFQSIAGATGVDEGPVNRAQKRAAKKAPAKKAVARKAPAKR